MKLAAAMSYSGGSPKEFARRVQDLESAGADLFTGGEIYGYDLATTLGFVAANTERAELMSGIFPVYSRSAALIAQTAVTLDALSEGRFHLGIGTSGPQVVEGWHGVPYDKPLARTRDVVEICRKVWTRDLLTHDGDALTIPLPAELGTGYGKPIRLTAKPFRADIPIWIAAEGPKNVALAAEIANGWQPIFVVPDLLQQVFGEALASGSQKRDEKLGPLQILASTNVALGDRAAIEQARALTRAVAGFYIGGMGAMTKNFHAQLFARYGWEDEARQIQTLFFAGKRDEATALVPDAYIDQATLAGDEGWVRERIEVYRACGVTHLQVNPFGEEPLKIIEKIRDWAA